MNIFFCLLGFAVKRHRSANLRPCSASPARIAQIAPDACRPLTPLTVRHCQTAATDCRLLVPRFPPGQSAVCLSALGKTSTPQDAYQRRFAFLFSCEAFAFGLLLLRLRLRESRLPPFLHSFWPGLWSLLTSLLNSLPRIASTPALPRT